MDEIKNKLVLKLVKKDIVDNLKSYSHLNGKSIDLLLIPHGCKKIWEESELKMQLLPILHRGGASDEKYILYY